MLLIDVLIILACFIIFERASNFLVEGLGSVSEHFGLSEAVLGASVAAMGSSVPELGASAFSVVEGHPTIGFGTIIGSAIFNIAIIIGAVALIGKYKLSRRVFYRDGLFYLLTVIIAVVSTIDGALTRMEAILWVLSFLGYLGWLVYDARRGEPVPQEDFKLLPKRRAALYIIAGIGGISLGAWLLVQSVLSLTAEIGISETLFSLVVVAIGTSIADLFTSVQAARKGMASLAVSNAIGSNIFDILICLGVPLSFRASTPIQSLTGVSIFSLFAMALLALLLIRVKWTLTKRDAGILLGSYGLYLLMIPLI